MNPKLYQDPCIDYPIHNLALSFYDYVAKSKEIIATHCQELPFPLEKIINANMPYELKPTKPITSSTNPNKIKKGALLIHGFLDTPFIMKDIGKQLQDDGVLVRSIMLPGHATIPGSLLNVDYQEWIQAVRYGVSTLANEVEQIYFVGFSTGASLAIYHTLRDATQIAGIIMLAPAIQIKSPLAVFSNWPKPLSGIWPAAQWLYRGEEVDYTKYTSVAFNGIYQVYRLTQELKKIDHTKELPCPIFLALSYEDCIVKSTASIDYFLVQSNPQSRMVLFSGTPRTYDDPRIMIRNSHFPEWRIKNMSHISICTAPNNPHYGKQGDLPLASRVEENNHRIYGAITKADIKVYDFLYWLKLIDYQWERLTFNPDFDFMVGQITEFMK